MATRVSKNWGTASPNYKDITFNPNNINSKNRANCPDFFGAVFHFHIKKPAFQVTLSIGKFSKIIQFHIRF